MIAIGYHIGVRVRTSVVQLLHQLFVFIVLDSNLLPQNPNMLLLNHQYLCLLFCSRPLCLNILDQEDVVVLYGLELTPQYLECLL